MNTCGQCRFGKFMPDNMKMRSCHGLPPWPMVMPVKGGININMMRPVVKIDDMACSVFEMIGGLNEKKRVTDGTAAPGEPGSDTPATG